MARVIAFLSDSPLACSFLVYLQLPQANSEKILEDKPRLLPATFPSIDYVVGPYVLLLIASVNRLSLLLHPLDYIIFPILAFYNFLQQNTRHTLKMRSIVRDSNLCDCYISPSKSLNSRLLDTCLVVRTKSLFSLQLLLFSSHSVLSLFVALCPEHPLRLFCSASPQHLLPNISLQRSPGGSPVPLM